MIDEILLGLATTAALLLSVLGWRAFTRNPALRNLFLALAFSVLLVANGLLIWNFASTLSLTEGTRILLGGQFLSLAFLWEAVIRP